MEGAHGLIHRFLGRTRGAGLDHLREKAGLFVIQRNGHSCDSFFSGNRVAFFASSTGEVERVADILNEYSIPYQLGLEQFDSTPAYLAERAYLAGSVASIYVVKGLIRHGTAFPDSQLVVFGSEDLFETSELVARASVSKSALATFSADLIDLKPGDYVVHAEHGVAQYLGLREIAQGEAQGDYMLLEYAAGAKLYVPLTRSEERRVGKEWRAP